MSLKFEVYRGDDREWTLYFATASPYTLANAINITGWTVFFTVKNSPDDSDTAAVIKKDITSHTAPTEGKTSISIASADTDNKTPKEYYCDIQIKKSTGKIRTVDCGAFEIHTDITRRIS